MQCELIIALSWRVFVEQSGVGECLCVLQADLWISFMMAEGEGSALTVW